MPESHYSVEDLLYLMQRLRTPEVGCPWDLKQNYRSIAASTIEEAYEVVDAIEREDYLHLKEELGDLLFQTIFYSQLANEEGRFNFAEVVHLLVAKLIRRHPHVFPTGNLYTNENAAQMTEAQVKHNWEAIKKQEREAKGTNGVLADVPTTLPATSRALKLQKRAAEVGFDWPNAKGVIDKLTEETIELKEAIAAEDGAAVAAELGDLLFTCVNLARHLKVDPETALRAANNKFVRRFEVMERLASGKGTDLEALPQAEMEHLWIQAKDTEHQNR